jgi:hypothetical protein
MFHILSGPKPAITNPHPSQPGSQPEWSSAWSNRPGRTRTRRSNLRPIPSWQPQQQRGLLELVQALKGGKSAISLLSGGRARAGPCVGRGVAGPKSAEHPRGQLAPRGKRVWVGDSTGNACSYQLFACPASLMNSLFGQCESGIPCALKRHSQVRRYVPQSVVPSPVNTEVALASARPSTLMFLVDRAGLLAAINAAS